MIIEGVFFIDEGLLNISLLDEFVSAGRCKPDVIGCKQIWREIMAEVSVI